MPRVCKNPERIPEAKRRKHSADVSAVMIGEIVCRVSTIA